MGDALDGPEPPAGKTSGEIACLLDEVLDEGVQPQRARRERHERLHERGRLVGEVVPVADREPRGLDSGTQLAGGGEVAEFGLVGPGKWIVERPGPAGGDVPDG